MHCSALSFLALWYIPSLHALRIGIGMKLGTKSHVAPLFEALRPLSIQNHSIVYLASSDLISFAKDFSFIQSFDIGNPIGRDEFDTLFDNVTHIDFDPNQARFFDTFSALMQRQYKPFALQYRQTIREQELDFMICDFIDRACSDASHDAGIHYAHVGMLGIYTVPKSEWFVPTVFSPFRQSQYIASPWKRLKAFITLFFIHRKTQKNEHAFNQMRREIGFGRDQSLASRFPASHSESLETHLFLAHNVFGIDVARRISSNVLTFGPMIDPSEIGSLEPEIKSILDQHDNEGIAVLYIAFGSLLKPTVDSILSTRIHEAIDSLLAENPHVAIVWSSNSHVKSHTDALSQKYGTRFLLRKWINQKAVLLHPAIKVFMTHGGISSIMETVYAGKPILALPFIGDQFLNAANAQDAGISLRLTKETFTSDEMKDKALILLSAMIPEPAQNHTSRPLLSRERLAQLLHTYPDQCDMNWYNQVAQQTEKLKWIAKYRAEISATLVSNAILSAAQVGSEHLIPADVSLHFFDRFPIEWWSLFGLASVVCVYLFVRILSWIVSFLEQKQFRTRIAPRCLESQSKSKSKSKCH